MIYLQSLRPPETPPPNPTRHHLAPNRRPRHLLLPRRLHSPRKSLPTLRRHLHRSLEQIPHRLLTLHPRAPPTTAHRSPTPIPKHDRKPGSGPQDITAMVADNGMATLHRQRLPLLKLSRHINDIPLPHRNRQRSRLSYRPIFKTINGSARHRSSQCPLPPPSSKTQLTTNPSRSKKSSTSPAPS